MVYGQIYAVALQRKAKIVTWQFEFDCNIKYKWHQSVFFFQDRVVASFLAINELSPSLRFASENILLIGLWQGKGKPPFKTLFH